MNLIKQNDKRMNYSIRLYGCRFRCLLAIIEFIKKRAFKANEIISLYEDIVEKKDKNIMNHNCLCGSEEHIIFNIALQKYYKDNRTSIRQIGSMQDGIPTSWAGNKVPYDYMITKWETNTDDGHFTLSDNEDNKIYDPWNHVLQSLELKSKKIELLYRATRGSSLVASSRNFPDLSFCDLKDR